MSPGGGGGGTDYVSEARDVPTKGSNFQSLSGTGIYSIVQILGRGSNIPVWKGVPAFWKGVVKLPLRRIRVP